MLSCLWSYWWLSYLFEASLMSCSCNVSFILYFFISNIFLKFDIAGCSTTLLFIIEGLFSSFGRVFFPKGFISSNNSFLYLMISSLITFFCISSNTLPMYLYILLMISLMASFLYEGISSLCILLLCYYLLGKCPYLSNSVSRF